MLHDTDLMNVTDSDEKLLRRAAEILLKDIGKVEGIEINPLNPEKKTYQTLMLKSWFQKL